MNYIVCIPSEDQISRENCEKIHNILARMSDKYRLNIVPEPVKTKRIPSPPYYRKYRIYKEIRERDGNGEAYLTQEEESMILSVLPESGGRRTDEALHLCVPLSGKPRFKELSRRKTG